MQNIIIFLRDISILPPSNIVLFGFRVSSTGGVLVGLEFVTVWLRCKSIAISCFCLIQLYSRLFLTTSKTIDI